MNPCRVAIVTGSTSGIGLGIARAFAEAGHAVMLNGLGDPAEIEKTRADLAAATGARVLYHGADMSKPGEIAALVFRPVTHSARWTSSSTMPASRPWPRSRSFRSIATT